MLNEIRWLSGYKETRDEQKSPGLRKLTNPNNFGFGISYSIITFSKSWTWLKLTQRHLSKPYVMLEHYHDWSETWDCVWFCVAVLSMPWFWPASHWFKFKEGAVLPLTSTSWFVLG